MSHLRRKLALFVVGVVVITSAGWFAAFGSDPYARQMRPVYALIAAGEQGWGDEATRELDAIIARNDDPHVLAERLLGEADSSLVAEGMVLAVRTQHPDARRLVEQHLSDRRWNWSLGSNDQLAEQLRLKLDDKPIEPYVASWLARRSEGPVATGAR